MGERKFTESQAERIELFQDVYEGRIPKRVPVEVSVSWEAAIRYSGLELKEAQWNTELYGVFFDKVCKEFNTDKSPIMPTLRNPVHYWLLGSKAIIMSESGYMQHPEIYCLEPEEYDLFIEDPYQCMVEKLLPRLYEGLDAGKDEKALNLARAFHAKNRTGAVMGATMAEMIEKYQFAAFPAGGMTEAPFDFLADFIRSFSGIAKDIRRYPEKVLKACDAVLPHMQKLAVVPSSSRYSRTFIPLHMAPFMRPKDFDQFWWPTFKKLMDYIAEKNVGVKAFVEHDWGDKIDHLGELGNRVEFQLEYGDPQKIKQTLGNKHIISGLYPITLLQTGTEKECTDKAKALLDVLALDGGYIFNTDKTIYSLEGKIADNLKAVIETVKTYGRY